MKNRLSHIILGCCAVFFCAASVYAQGFDSIGPKGNKIFSSAQNYDTCAYLRTWKYDEPQTEQEYKVQYDSLRAYIEKCAASDSNSWDVFSTIDGAVQFMSNDTTRFDKYRNWLLSVLYLNTSMRYFCSCFGAIDVTYQFGKYYGVGGMAVDNYARTYHRECWDSRGDSLYAKDSIYWVEHGYDMTHLPSMDSLGLGIVVRHDKKGVTTSPAYLPTVYLSSFTSSPNPFKSETTLEFTLNRMSYVTLAVYDDLGRLVWGDGKGSSLEAGTHTVQIDGAKLPGGTLYVRIATGFGEVKTVKLVHEK